MEVKHSSLMYPTTLLCFPQAVRWKSHAQSQRDSFLNHFKLSLQQIRELAGVFPGSSVITFSHICRPHPKWPCYSQACFTNHNRDYLKALFRYSIDTPMIQYTLGHWSLLEWICKTMNSLSQSKPKTAYWIMLYVHVVVVHFKYVIIYHQPNQFDL